MPGAYGGISSLADWRLLASVVAGALVATVLNYSASACRGLLRQRAPKDGPDAEDDAPPHYVDVITMDVMDDPAVLAGTGQVYNYGSLREWLRTGARTCPRTNLPLVDVEVVRLPLLRASIREWMVERGLEVEPLETELPAKTLEAADPEVPGWVTALRCGDAGERGLAAAAVNDRLIQWGADAAAGAVGRHTLACRARVMEAILEDLVWLLRHGQPYGQGCAAAALSQYHDAQQRRYLAATAALPAAALLASPDDYARHAAARLLNELCRAHACMPDVLLGSGVVPLLLQQVDLRRAFTYIRSPAASTLWALAADGHEGVVAAVRAEGGIELLTAMVLQPEELNVTEAEAGSRERLIRFDKRDAAGALLALEPTQEELEAVGVCGADLELYSKCSPEWLQGLAHPLEPRPGNRVVERRARRTPGGGAGDAAGEGEGGG